MAKFALTLVFVVFAVGVQGLPTSYDDIVAAAKAGDFDKLQALINSNAAPNQQWKPFNFDNIRNLKPLEGGQVYGEAEYTYQSSSDFNGQKTQESGGHKVVNDNGRVNEFDIKPKFH